MKAAVLNAPKFDEPTEHSLDWSREVKGWLENKGYAVVDISGRETNRSEVEAALKNHPRALFIHYNHGSEDKLWGSKTEAVVDLKNVDLLADRPVYCMNCLSAQKLGVEVWKRGCMAYYGYVQVFAFSTEALEAFKTFANYGIFLYLEGETWSELLSKAREKGRELSAKLASEGKYLASILMSQDTDALHCWNGEEPPPEVSKCFLRRTAVRLLGRTGWMLSRKFSLSLLIFSVGFGVGLHDFCHALWEVGGYSEILSLQGGYFGFLLMLMGFILGTYEYGKWMRR